MTGVTVTDEMSTTREQVVARIAETTGQHTRWLRFEDRQAAWFNGSDFVCQMDWVLCDSEGNGEIVEWAPRHQVTA